MRDEPGGVEVDDGGFFTTYYCCQLGAEDCKNSLEFTASIQSRVVGSWMSLHDPSKKPLQKGDDWADIIAKVAHDPCSACCWELIFDYSYSDLYVSLQQNLHIILHINNFVQPHAAGESMRCGVSFARGHSGRFLQFLKTLCRSLVGAGTSAQQNPPRERYWQRDL